MFEDDDDEEEEEESSFEPQGTYERVQESVRSRRETNKTGGKETHELPELLGNFESVGTVFRTSDL